MGSHAHSTTAVYGNPRQGRQHNPNLNEEKVSTCAKKYQVKGTTRFEELLEDPAVPVIGLFTGPSRRADFVRKIIRAGKDVMTTKPFERDPQAVVLDGVQLSNFS